ncbi:MAG: replicative DNA helicase [Candidatus Sericytochromatia bacterium]
MSIERVTPNNLEAERAVIGSMLLDKEAIAKVLELLSVNCFYLASHQLIFKAVNDLYHHNQPADLVTVSDQLKLQGFLEDVGGYKYLFDLVESVPTTANVEKYAKIVEEKYIRRELIRVSNEITEMAYSSTMDISGLLDSAEKGIFAIGQKRFTKDLVPIGSMLVDSYNVVTSGYPEDGSPFRQINLKTGIKSGLTDMDTWTNGLNPSDLIIIAARPAMGKTAFCLNIALNIALKERLPVAIFSLEMSKEQLAQRMLSAHSNINNHALKTGNIEPSQWESLTKATADLYDAPIFVDDTSVLSPIEMRSKIRRLKAEHKKLGAVIVDYLQLMETKGNEANRVQEIAKITRSLKQLAREMDVPVLALSQLSRTVEQRQNKRPQLSDLRESGCVTGDTLVIDYETGIRTPIKELLGKKITTPAMNENLKISKHQVSNVFYSGKKMVYEIKTRSGKKIKASANHKFFKLNGWERLDKLKIGDKIATVSNLYNSDLLWDEILDIKEIGIEDVYDATVDIVHNFVANDFIVHNSIEQDADIVMFIYRDEYYNPNSDKKKTAEIIIAKHRNGPVGTVNLYFDAALTKFSGLEGFNTREGG